MKLLEILENFSDQEAKRDQWGNPLKIRLLSSCSGSVHTLSNSGTLDKIFSSHLQITNYFIF